MVNKLFEYLVPILNGGLKALYRSVYAAVLAATQGNTVAARLAAEAALIALKPAIMENQHEESRSFSNLSARKRQDEHRSSLLMMTSPPRQSHCRKRSRRRTP